MANITAKDVAALRAQTGLGMMDCKKALVEAEGDVEKAVKILREKGLATAEKKAGRVAAEGRVDILSKNGITAMVEVNSETDFVAKSDHFKDFVTGLLETIVANLKKEGIENVEVAPLQRVHKALDSVKRYRDTSGNNMNHPGDYLHRIYAQVALETICGYSKDYK